MKITASMRKELLGSDTVKQGPVAMMAPMSCETDQKKRHLEIVEEIDKIRNSLEFQQKVFFQSLRGLVSGMKKGTQYNFTIVRGDDRLIKSVVAQPVMRSLLGGASK